MASEIQKTYSLDSCALLTFQSFYPIDLFPQVWNKLDDLLKTGQVYLIEEVYLELEKRDDVVYQWLKARKSYCVKAITSEALVKAKEIMGTHQNLIDINATQTAADPFVIAESFCSNSTVVTREEMASSNAKRPKIPNVSLAYGVQCIHGQYYATEFFRELGWQF